MPVGRVSTLIASIFAAMSMAMLVVVGQAESAAASPSADRQSVSADKLVGHQPAKSRVTTVGDRSDAPQHRAAPWMPLALAPDEGAFAGPERGTGRFDAPPTPWQAYDIEAEQGRDPPKR